MILQDLTMETTTNVSIRVAEAVFLTTFAGTSLGAEPVLCTPSATRFCVLF